MILHGHGWHARRSRFGPIGPLTITYPTNMGTSTDQTNGLVTFTFGGGRKIWVNSVSGLDTNDGLTPATAKQTLAAAITLFQNGSFTAGDWLMLAQGSSFTDPATTNFSLNYGVSATNVTGVFSYDPADPTNPAKWGRAINGTRPIVSVPDSANCTFSTTANLGVSGRGNIAIQGIAFTTPGTPAGFGLLTFRQRFDNICVQNCTFDKVQLSKDGAVDYATLGGSTGCIISGNAFYGAFATGANSSTAGNASGIFWGDQGAGNHIFRNIFVHNGWKIGVSRDAGPTNGGPNVLGHGIYYAATNGSSNVYENIFVDVAVDGANFRGPANHWNNVSIDCAVGAAFGGKSGDYTEAPNGVLITGTDMVICGGANINSTANGTRGYGPAIVNTNLGSYLKNSAMFDNPYYGIGNNTYWNTQFDVGGLPAGQGNGGTWFTYQNISGWNYSPNGDALNGGYAAAQPYIHPVYTNVIADVVFTGTGNSSSSGGSVFSNKKTRAQMYTALGFSSKAAFLNAIIYTPQFAWATAFVSIALPSVNLTPTYKTQSVPSMSGITPTVVFGQKPVNSVAPTITGSAVNGSTLSVNSNGTWSNTGSLTYYYYQWYKNGVAITDQVQSTYTTVAGDVGGVITCRVSATNVEQEGGTFVASSNSITVT